MLWLMQAVVSLTTQYRMAEDIQLLANTLMYNSALRPGSAAVASAMLHLPHHPLPGLPSWLSRVSTVNPRGADSKIWPNWTLPKPLLLKVGRVRKLQSCLTTCVLSSHAKS